MKKSLYLLILIASTPLYGQLLEIDYSSFAKKESLFKVSLFKQLLGGVNTLGHVELHSEVLKIHFSNKKGFISGLTLVGTSSIFSGNKDDKKNNLSHLLNPLGGINGSLYFSLPLQGKEKSSLRINSQVGTKWIQGTPLRGSENSFLSPYGLLGFVYQRLLFEDAIENQRIDFWTFPRLMASQINKEDLTLFFNDKLESLSYGYGIETGVELNRKVRLVLLLNQFVNTLDPDTMGRPVFRFSLGYRF